MARRCRVPSLRLASRPARNPGVRRMGRAGSAAVDLSRDVLGRRTGKPAAALGADHEGVRRSVAAQSGGLLIDWVTREIVLAASQPERASFHLGDQWLGFELHVHDERHQSPSAEACAALRLQTRGLVRFGVPEIGIDRVDCGNRLVALNVLRALAQHLFSGAPSRPGSARVKGRVRRVLGLDNGRRQRLHRHSCRTGRCPLGRWPTRRATQRLARRPRGESSVAGGLPSRRLLDVRPARGVHRRPAADLSPCSDFAASCQVIADHSSNSLRSAA